ncbi:MAG: HepT-like ribonuclease domain-containing protein, partial [bacterium]|nr:HepT-like ribonuclease domain-containing protein [bacterium]
GVEFVKQQGWKEPDTLEELFYLLQEQAVIDSDLVDQMIAMYRVRPDLIIHNLEKNDLELVDEILRQNLADIRLYLKQVKEYTSVTNRNKKNIQH